MATSEVQIANIALTHLGEPFITSFTEGSTAATICGERYPITRDAVLRDHHWNFALARRKLTQSSTAPEFGWQYSYPLPTDYISALSIDEHFHLRNLQFGSQTAYVIEGSNLLTDANEAYLTYIKREETVSRFDPLFVEAVAARLAVDISFALTGSHGNTDVAHGIYKESLKKARARDARELGYQRPTSTTIKVRPIEGSSSLDR